MQRKFRKKERREIKKEERRERKKREEKERREKMDPRFEMRSKIGCKRMFLFRAMNIKCTIFVEKKRKREWEREKKGERKRERVGEREKERESGREKKRVVETIIAKSKSLSRSLKLAPKR